MSMVLLLWSMYVPMFVVLTWALNREDRV